MGKAPPPPQFSTRKGTGAVVLAGIDGRSLLARRFREIATRIESDFGGDLAEAQRHLVALAARLAIWCEEREPELGEGGKFDAGHYATIANSLRRLMDAASMLARVSNNPPAAQAYKFTGCAT